LSFAAERRKKRQQSQRLMSVGNVADTDVDEDSVDEVVGSLDTCHQIWPMSISCMRAHTHTHHTFIDLHTRALQRESESDHHFLSLRLCY